MSKSNCGTGGKTPEPFRTHAAKYFDIGLPVFPCAGEVGKKPLVRWKRLQTRQVSATCLDGWSNKFPTANIGLATGKLSGITVIDSDDPDIKLDALFKKYGATPLVVQTPRGGYHLYYKYSGEVSKIDKNTKIDIKGKGGFVIMPPSYNFTSLKPYHYVIGDICDIQNLPTIQTETLQYVLSEGERNNALFKNLLRSANSFHSFSSLVEFAEKYNISNLMPPLSIEEVTRTAKSVWGYKEKGTLYNGGDQFLKVSFSHMKEWVYKYPAAGILYLDLISCHRGVREIFAISAKAYAHRLNWSPSTIRKFIKVLMEYKVIECIHRGGKKPGDASLYSFTHGDKFNLQYNNTSLMSPT